MSPIGDIYSPELYSLIIIIWLISLPCFDIIKIVKQMFNGASKTCTALTRHKETYQMNNKIKKSSTKIVPSVTFTDAISAIRDYDKAWKVYLMGVVKVARTEDKRLDTDSQSISRAVGEYIVLAKAYNLSRPTGDEGDEKPVDFKGLSKHIKTLVNEEGSRAFNKRVQRGVRHQLLVHVDGAKDIFEFIDGVLMGPHNVLVPRIAAYDDDGKQIGTTDNPTTDMVPVRTSDVDRMWSSHAPKTVTGPVIPGSRTGTEQQAIAANVDLVLTDFAQLVRRGTIPHTLAGKKALLACLQSGITTSDVMNALENGDDEKVDAVA
jgi:hypothetical protein